MHPFLFFFFFFYAGYLPVLSIISILKSFSSLGGLLPYTFIRSIAEESFRKEIFEEYIAHLEEKAKEKERKREEEKVSESFYNIMFK